MMSRNTFGDVVVTLFAVIIYILNLYIIRNRLGTTVNPYVPLIGALLVTGTVMLAIWGIIVVLRRGRKP